MLTYKEAFACADHVLREVWFQILVDLRIAPMFCVGIGRYQANNACNPISS